MGSWGVGGNSTSSVSIIATLSWILLWTFSGSWSSRGGGALVPFLRLFFSLKRKGTQVSKQLNTQGRRDQHNSFFSAVISDNQKAWNTTLKIVQVVQNLTWPLWEKWTPPTHLCSGHGWYQTTAHTNTGQISFGNAVSYYLCLTNAQPQIQLGAPMGRSRAVKSEVSPLNSSQPSPLSPKAIFGFS